jgi:hypothetical protein
MSMAQNNNVLVFFTWMIHELSWLQMQTDWLGLRLKNAGIKMKKYAAGVVNAILVTELIIRSI